jgi:hypothetical protein
MKTLTPALVALVSLVGCTSADPSATGESPTEPIGQSTQELVRVSLACQPLINTVGSDPNPISESESLVESANCPGATSVEMFTMRGAAPQGYPWNVFNCTGGSAISRLLGDGSCEMLVNITGCNIFGVTQDFYGEGHFYLDSSNVKHFLGAQNVVMHDNPVCVNHMTITEQQQ